MQVIVMHAGDAETTIRNHFKRHGKTYLKIGVMTFTAFLMMHGTAFAGDGNLEATGMKLYRKVKAIGKWILLIKGATHVIEDCMQSDFKAARTHGIAYLLSYAVLVILPWGMNEVDNTFDGGI
ncbi:MAG: hypothetical protein ACYCX4_14480 [Bacillota bacterium]